MIDHIIIGTVVLPRYSYYTNNLPVYFSSLNCIGNETSIWNCPYTLRTTQYCYYRNDAAIVCQCK